MTSSFFVASAAKELAADLRERKENISGILGRSFLDHIEGVGGFRKLVSWDVGKGFLT